MANRPVRDHAKTTSYLRRINMATWEAGKSGVGGVLAEPGAKMTITFGQLNGKRTFNAYKV